MRCQVQVGGVTCRLVSDGNVSVSYVIVSETEEEDLRAMQRTHNEEIIEWIEAVSAGRNAALSKDELLLLPLGHSRSE